MTSSTTSSVTSGSIPSFHYKSPSSSPEIPSSKVNTIATRCIGESSGSTTSSDSENPLSLQRSYTVDSSSSTCSASSSSLRSIPESTKAATLRTISKDFGYMLVGGLQCGSWLPHPIPLIPLSFIPGSSGSSSAEDDIDIADLSDSDIEETTSIGEAQTFPPMSTLIKVTYSINQDKEMISTSESAGPFVSFSHKGNKAHLVYYGKQYSFTLRPGVTSINRSIGSDQLSVIHPDNTCQWINPLFVEIDI